MKQKALLIIFLFSSVFKLLCQNFNLDDRYCFTVYSGLARIDLKDSNLIYVFNDENKSNVSVPYNLIHKDGLLFLKLAEKVPKEVTEDYIYKSQKDIITDDKFLILAGKDKGLNTTILLATTKGFDNRYPCTDSIISERVQAYKDCSSFLKEREKEYPVTNLSIKAVDSPWIEAVPGDGIGEGFTLVNSWGYVYSYILLMNGYISYEKPYLYKQNGRVKKLKVTGLKSGKSKILDILDTPHPQTVDISFITEPEDIRVEIADVYKGTKYDDTCIHYMITYEAEVIPYENSIDVFLSPDNFDK